MPKIKTRKSAAKRIVKVSSGAAVWRRKTLAQHLVHRKSKRTIKQSGASRKLSKVQAKKLTALAPYK